MGENMASAKDVLIGSIVVLVLVAAYVSFFTAPEVEIADDSLAESLLLRAVKLGSGETNYYYSFSEDTSGYTKNYSLLRKGDDKRLDIINPFSHKSFYWSENESVLCTDFKSEGPVCSSIINQSSSDRYILSLESKFFNDELINKTVSDMEFMKSKGYLTYDPEVDEKTVWGKKCSEVRYRLDFRNISINDGIRLGVGATTPKEFDMKICVDNETGEVYEKYFNYTYNTRDYWVYFLLIDSDWDTGRELGIPQNLTPEGEAYYRFYEEMEYEGTLLDCFSKEGEERESCISAEAIRSRSIGVCELAGSRRDRCLVSFIPITQDESICDNVISEFFRDDCYTEIAGWKKDNSFCDFVKNESKKEYCLSISVVNETADEVEEFFMDVLQDEGGEQNETEANNS